MPRSGIEYAGELHHRLAARWAGYKFTSFRRLGGVEQSAIVASYECAMQIEAVTTYEQLKKAIRDSRA